MDRRSFIKLTAVTGTTALAGCGRPDEQLVRFLPDEDIVPGASVWKPGVCTACPSGCGLTVRVTDADADVVRNGQAGVLKILAAKKLEGSRDHPVNAGRLCARGQAAIQLTYHPDRITQPLRRTGERGERAYEAVSWDDAIAELAERLDGLGEARPKPVAYLMRRTTGHRPALVAQLLERIGAPPPVVVELFSDVVLRRANAVVAGREQLPTVDLARARFVISFGADILGTWNSPVAQSVGYGLMRQGRPGIRGTFVQVEPRMSQTGANADEWVPVPPGTEGMLALGLAHIMLAEGLRPRTAAPRAAALIQGWSDGLPEYDPASVEQATGVRAERIERLARQLAAESPAVAIVGGAPLAQTNALFTAMAVNALNELLGSIGAEGGLSFTPQIDLPGRRPGAGFDQVARDLLEGSPAAARVVLVDGANPVFTSPPAWRAREALLRAPFIASFSSFLDETTALADLILPDHTFLETWSDAVPESGSLTAVVSAAPPVMRPLHDTRDAGDVLLEVARRLSTPIEFPWTTVEEMLAATFARLPGPSAEIDAWTDAQEKGGWWGTLPPALAARPTPSPPSPAFRFEPPQFDGASEEYPFHLLPYPSPVFYDGSMAHLPWLQEMPDPVSSAMWSSWVEINPATAAGLNIGQGDVVEVSSTQGAIRAAAMITPGIAPDIVAIPVGQGHEEFTRYATGRGVNPVTLLAPLAEPATGALAWAATKVRVTRVGNPDGRLILFAGGMREHADESR